MFHQFESGRRSANKDFKRVSTLFHPEKGLLSDFWSFMVNKVWPAATMVALLLAKRKNLF